MGVIITIKYKRGDMNYEFDLESDGIEFKKDIERGFKKNGKKTKIIIKKIKDIKKPVEKGRYEI